MKLQVKVPFQPFLFYLLDCQDRHELIKRLEENIFVDQLKKNLVLLRTYELVSDLPNLPVYFMSEVEKEKKRVNNYSKYLLIIQETASKEKIPVIFVKALQHWPDMGHDIDLFVPEKSRRIDLLLKKHLTLEKGEQSLFNRFARKTSFHILPECVLLEIHHDLVGLMGEHSLFSRKLMEKKLSANINGGSIPIPSLENQLLIQVIQRAYMHRGIRIGDFLQVTSLMFNKSLNWNVFSERAKAIGVWPGCQTILSYICSIININNQNSFQISKIKKLINFNKISFSFKEGREHLLNSNTFLRLHLKKVLFDLLHFNISSLWRFCLAIPLSVCVKISRLLVPPNKIFLNSNDVTDHEDRN